MISTRSLCKEFSTGRGTSVQAVRGISLTIEPGELVAVLGPNGAGKTTLIRMLTTLIAPTSGSATVAGHDVEADGDAVRRAIGYVGQGSAAGHAQRVGDEVFTQAVIHGLRRRAAHLRAAELLEAFDLTDLALRKVSDLSGGQRRRLDVAMGLVNSPPLLFLDEPSTGLDPQNRANLWEHILRTRAEAGMTVLLTTHYLDEADTMAERVVVVDRGEVIADDTAETLKAQLAGDRIVVTAGVGPHPGSAATPGGDRSAASHLADLARHLRGAREVTVTGDEVSVRVTDGPGSLPELVRAAEAAGARIATAQVHRPTLDDVFLSLTGRSLRESDGAAGAPAGAPEPTSIPTSQKDAA